MKRRGREGRDSDGETSKTYRWLRPSFWKHLHDPGDTWLNSSSATNRLCVCDSIGIQENKQSVKFEDLDFWNMNWNDIRSILYPAPSRTPVLCEPSPREGLWSPGCWSAQGCFFCPDPHGVHSHPRDGWSFAPGICGASHWWQESNECKMWLKTVGSSL